jgi:hypothetical protein
MRQNNSMANRQPFQQMELEQLAVGCSQAEKKELQSNLVSYSKN